MCTLCKECQYFPSSQVSREPRNVTRVSTSLDWSVGGTGRWAGSSVEKVQVGSGNQLHRGAGLEDVRRHYNQLQAVLVDSHRSAIDK